LGSSGYFAESVVLTDTGVIRRTWKQKTPLTVLRTKMFKAHIMDLCI